MFVQKNLVICRLARVKGNLTLSAGSLVAQLKATTSSRGRRISNPSSNPLAIITCICTCLVTRCTFAKGEATSACQRVTEIWENIPTAYPWMWKLITTVLEVRQVHNDVKSSSKEGHSFLIIFKFLDYVTPLCWAKIEWTIKIVHGKFNCITGNVQKVLHHIFMI